MKGRIVAIEILDIAYDRLSCLSNSITKSGVKQQHSAIAIDTLAHLPRTDL